MFLYISKLNQCSTYLGFMTLVTISMKKKFSVAKFFWRNFIFFSLMIYILLLYNISITNCRYIHSMQLVHMDIKPGNIFISKEQRLLPLNYDSADDGFEELEEGAEEVTYKIG